MLAMSNFSNKISTATLVPITGRPNELGLYFFKNGHSECYWSVEKQGSHLTAFQLLNAKKIGYKCDASQLQDRHWKRLTWTAPDHCFGWDITGWDLLDGVPDKDGFYLFITEDSEPQIAHRMRGDSYVECVTGNDKDSFTLLSKAHLKVGRWAKFNYKTTVSSRCWNPIITLSSALLSKIGSDITKVLSKRTGFFLRKNIDENLYIAKMVNGRLTSYVTRTMDGTVKILLDGPRYSCHIANHDYFKKGSWFKFQASDGNNEFWLAGYRRGVMGLPITDSNLEQNKYYLSGHSNGLYYLHHAKGETLAEVVKNTSQANSGRITDKQARSMRAIFNLPEPRST